MRDMRYRRSAAREEALGRLKSLQSGALIASRRSIPTLVRNLTFHSAIFQASATLEEYLKQVFDHWLFELKRHGRTGASIPSRARFSYFGREMNEAFSSFAHAGDERRLAQKIEGKVSLIEFTLGSSGVPPYLNGEFAYKDKKYPSPKNIKSLYARIGCDDIFAKLSRVMRSDAEMKLQAFNDIRTSIAHGAPPNLTISDVKRNLCDIKEIIKSLDRINHGEFSKHFGSGIW